MSINYIYAILTVSIITVIGILIYILMRKSHLTSSPCICKLGNEPNYNSYFNKNSSNTPGINIYNNANKPVYILVTKRPGATVYIDTILHKIVLDGKKIISITDIKSNQFGGKIWIWENKPSNWDKQIEQKSMDNEYLSDGLGAGLVEYSLYNNPYISPSGKSGWDYDISFVKVGGYPLYVATRDINGNTVDGCKMVYSGAGDNCTVADIVTDCKNTVKVNGTTLCKDPKPEPGDTDYATWVHSKGNNMIFANAGDVGLANQCNNNPKAVFLDIVVFPNCGKY